MTIEAMKEKTRRLERIVKGKNAGKTDTFVFSEVRKMIELALAEAREANGWQPIETAPKDGSSFRAYDKSLVHADFNPEGSVEAVFNGKEFIGAVWDGCHDNWVTIPIKFTKWMSPPAAQKDEVNCEKRQQHG